MKKYKIYYQKNHKKKECILDAKNLVELKNLENYPQNVFHIKEIKSFKFTLPTFRNHKKDILEFFSQLDIMLYSHLTFSESIDLLLDLKQEKIIYEILDIMKQSLSSSISIDESLKEYKKYLGETNILFLKLGFENGNIKESIHSLVEILAQDMESQEKFADVVRYPKVLCTSLFVSVAMIFIYVLPNFDFIFTLLEDDLPYPTKILLWVKSMVDNYSFLIMIVIVLLAVSISYLKKRYKYFFDKIVLLHIPFLSNVKKEYYFYRLFFSISIIVKSKHQFQIAISNSENIVDNLYVQEKMRDILYTITNGSSIAEAFEHSNIFDSVTIKLLSTAEYTNEYESILSDITLRYKKRFLKGLEIFSSTLEPLLILIISLVVLWLILAVMLPIWNLGSVIN